MRILISPDKFKGTLTAAEAARAIARGWSRARPGDRLVRLPICDGGDGFGEILGRLLKSKRLSVQTVDAAGQPIRAGWWLDSKTGTAVIESATVIGLALLPPGRFHPFELDTHGLGAVLQAASKTGARCCLVGIGGSATNDGGFGMARSLGWAFYDKQDEPITQWTGLAGLARIVPPRRRRLFRDLRVAVDVRNPLLGSRGATRIYGPQKGIRPGEFRKAECCLARLAEVCRQQLGVDTASVPGSGAAGGLGFGLMTFLGAQFEPGFELFARQAGLDERLESVDLVITGEGAIDRSTLMGKGVGQMAALARAHGLPCIGMAGTTGLEARSLGPFTAVYGLTSLTSPAQAKRHPAKWLERLAARVARSAGGPGRSNVRTE